MLPPTNKRINLIISLLLSLTLLWAINYFVGWQTLWQSWQLFEIDEALIILSILIMSYALRAIRVMHHFGFYGRQETMVCIRLTILHNFWNNLLPMRTGEASFPILMKSHFQISLSHSLPALIWMRILDLIVLIFFAAIALGSLWLEPEWVILLCVLGLSTPFTLFALYHQWLRHRPSLKPFWIKVDDGLPKDQKHVAWGFFWTLFNWGIKIAALAWVLSWFVDLNFSQLLTGVIGGEFSSVLPFHGFAGMGTYEAGVLIGFGESFRSESAQLETLLLAAINLHLIVFGSSVFAALMVYFVRHPNHSTERGCQN